MFTQGKEKWLYAFIKGGTEKRAKRIAREKGCKKSVCYGMGVLVEIVSAVSVSVSAKV